MALCKIAGPTLPANSANAWPDVIFNLLKSEEQKLLIDKRRRLEQTIGVRPPHISPLPAWRAPQLVLTDSKVSDSQWHKNRYALANTKYTYASSLGLPACVKNNMFSVNYDTDIPSVVPTNRAGKDSYVVIRDDDTRTFEKVLFECKGSGGESLSLEEYVKRQDKIIQNYEQTKNLTLTEIGVVLNTHNRKNPKPINTVIDELATETYTDMQQILEGIEVDGSSVFDCDTACMQINIMCNFPKNKTGHFRLANLESFIELMNASAEELEALDL